MKYDTLANSLTDVVYKCIRKKIRSSTWNVSGRAYQYTDIHKTALQLFYLYLAGELVGGTPQELLETAIQGAACNRKDDDLRKDEGDDEARRDE